MEFHFYECNIYKVPLSVSVVFCESGVERTALFLSSDKMFKRQPITFNTTQFKISVTSVVVCERVRCERTTFGAVNLTEGKAA